MEGRGAKHQAPQVLSLLFEISHLCLSPFQSLQTAARWRQRAEKYCDAASEAGEGERAGEGGTLDRRMARLPWQPLIQPTVSHVWLEFRERGEKE